MEANPDGSTDQAALAAISERVGSSGEAQLGKSTTITQRLREESMATSTQALALSTKWSKLKDLDLASFKSKMLPVTSAAAEQSEVRAASGSFVAIGDGVSPSLSQACSLCGYGKKLGGKRSSSKKTALSALLIV